MIRALLAGMVPVFVGVFVLRPRVGGLLSGDFQGIKTEAFVAPGDTETLELLNQGLDRARSDGTITRLEQQFLGAAPAGS